MTSPHRLSVALAAAMAGTLAAGTALAEAGRVTGQIDGAAIAQAIAADPDARSGLFVERHVGGGVTELTLDLMAVSEGRDGFEGVMISLTLEADGDVAAADFTPDMLVDAVAMIVEDWPADAEDPSAVWLAELGRAETFGLDRLELGDTQTALAGQVASRRFCLHEIVDFEPVPLRRDGGMICRSGALQFAAGGAGGAQDAPPRGPMEVEVLGRIEGMVGTQAFDWLTVLPASGAGTASWGRADDGTRVLRIQGHSPASSDFLNADVLSIEIWSEGDVPEASPIPADVTFVVEGTGGMPRVFYTSTEGEGAATATIWHLSLGGEEDQIRVEVSGRLCRVEGLTPIPGDCRTIRATATTELIDAGDPFR